MNVVQILDEPWDSAITDYGLSLSAALRAKGHRVTVLARRGAYAWRAAEGRGLPVEPLGPLLGFRGFLKKRGVELVNAHTGAGHFRGWWGTAGTRTALVRTRGDARPVGRKGGWLYRRTDAVISASRCIGGQYHAAFPDISPRLATVYPGLSVPPFSPEPAGPLRVALVGRLDPVKGQSYFLEAVQTLRGSLKDEEFLIVGEEKSTPLEELKRAAETLHVARWVRFLGRQQDVGAFMAGCHVGVVASIGSEALSRVCLEWMSRGRPVVASAVGCLPELVYTGENGFLVPPRSPQAMATCLRTLIEQADFRRHLGRQAHAWASENFSIGRFARETEAVYEVALKRRWGRGA
jgi:glycosyltransferase involved in cell wall biosynthesis